MASLFKKSSGVLVYRLTRGYLEFLLLHPGGPFYTKKDLGVWSIPKGEFEEEDAKTAAIREFEEETGQKLDGELVNLGEIKMKSGKTVYCWALEKDVDISEFKSNFFEMEWPPKSGLTQKFPEMDKAEWFILKESKEKIHPSQIPFLDRIIEMLKLEENQINPNIPLPKNEGGAGQLDLFS